MYKNENSYDINNLSSHVYDAFFRYSGGSRKMAKSLHSPTAFLKPETLYNLLRPAATFWLTKQSLGFMASIMLQAIKMKRLKSAGLLSLVRIKLGCTCDVQKSNSFVPPPLRTEEFGACITVASIHDEPGDRPRSKRM